MLPCQEKKVKEDMIRIPQRKGANSHSKQAKASASAAAESAEEASNENEHVFRVGMDVEARFGGKGEWHAAKVTKKSPGKGGTTYNLQYKDGRSVSSQVGNVHRAKIWGLTNKDANVHDTRVLVNHARFLILFVT